LIAAPLLVLLSLLPVNAQLAPLPAPTDEVMLTVTGAIGVTSGMLKMYAINDYVVEVPVSDAVEGGPILAYAQNGERMSVRDKGPLWLLYPYDANPDYRTEVVYSRSIWQLVKIEVVP
jgi:hypothetical protein